ncbi:TetR/AcrR family transcriptional regulator [Nocardiopsis composta]|uniref:AcrR family transcriptional regulator n=1 Tax=Nocardiopsis composta TaxID=157465 RepID=A0A7W8VFX5_9ACTN|nr:TetR/AcrR family transcriptional regulator [Nocardiopsis composta]MBB5434424.1 AcrR family transcriptional regulator [Nocardiopsis composta]
MGRPRKFDEDEVVEAACRVFWRGGYDGTSTDDLCRATGLTRSSLYNSFTSKEELFVRALRRYAEERAERQTAVLEDQGRSGLERIRALLAMIVEDEMGGREQGRGSGCFTVNTQTSSARRNPAVAEVLDADLRKRLGVLEGAIRAGQADGSIAADRAPAELAWYVNSLVGGARVAGQAGVGREVLEGVMATGVRALEP